MCKELLTETINVCGFMYLTILLDKITNLFKSKLAALEQCRNVLSLRESNWFAGV